MFRSLKKVAGDRADNKRLSGFTLVELLVTISIFAIVTGIVMYNQTKFNSTIFLTNLAYDVSLTIRQAQTYGVNVRRFEPKSGPSTADFSKPYGVHFSVAPADIKSFVLYADVDGNKTLTIPVVGVSISDAGFCASNDECLQTLSMKRGNYIKDIRIQTTGGEYISGPSDPIPRVLDITFKRPEPDAIVTTYPSVPYPITSATITLASSDDPTSLRYVKVNTTGQISVERNP